MKFFNKLWFYFTILFYFTYDKVKFLFYFILFYFILNRQWRLMSCPIVHICFLTVSGRLVRLTVQTITLFQMIAWYLYQMVPDSGVYFHTLDILRVPIIPALVSDMGAVLTWFDISEFVSDACSCWVEHSLRFIITAFLMGFFTACLIDA